MPKLNQKGFTLIELLIVIIIIAILASLLAVSYTTIQRNARDSERKGDLAAVAGVIERFYSDNSVYPSSDSGRIAYENNCQPGVTNTQDWGSEGVDCNSTNYVRQLPQDPTGTNEYCYVSLNNNQRYELYASLEGQGNFSGSVPASCTGSSYNYRVTSND